MKAPSTELQRWAEIVAPLTMSSAPGLISTRSNYLKSSACRVEVIAKPSRITATISWRDSMGCRYDDQTWRRGLCRAPGVCALTGLPIMSGDEIYRPAPMPHAPANATHMILANVLRQLDCEE
jgi:hypothetical protein